MRSRKRSNIMIEQGKWSAMRHYVMLWKIGLGAQGRNRTTDTCIFSAVLYRLSYLGYLGYLSFLGVG
jgi:hypothetical protein